MSQIETEYKRRGFIPSPGIVGTVVEKEGQYLIEIFDHKNAKMLVAVNPAFIATVTIAVEERIVRPASSLITTP